MEHRTATVALVDNDPLTLSLLVQRLPQWVPGIRIIWHTDSGSKALHNCAEPESCPDILLLDMSLKEHENGVQVCRSIRRLNDSMWILGMTSYSLRHYARDLAAAGAQGIVSKGDLKMLAFAINSARHKHLFNPLTEDIPFKLPEEAHQEIASLNDSDSKPRLSPQEERIFDLLSKGYDYAAVAKEFNIAPSSVRTQAHRAVKKLGANTLAHALVLWVTQHNENDA